MNTLPFLLFDLGGVLIEHIGFPKLKAWAGPGIDDAQLKRRLLASPALRAFELGTLSPRDFAEQFVAEWPIPLSVEAFLVEFRDWPKGFYPGVLDGLVRLRQHTRIGCLSNANAVHWEKFQGFQGLFDVTLSSHLIGAIKPDQAAFEYAIQACGVPQSDILFFDDSWPNVEAAQACGLQAERVDGWSGVQSALTRRGFSLR